MRGEGDQRREEVEEQSRDETNRNAGIASVSGELMRKITSRRGGGRSSGTSGGGEEAAEQSDSYRKVTERGHCASI